jgi:hypothetical protein
MNFYPHSDVKVNQSLQTEGCDQDLLRMLDLS